MEERSAGGTTEKATELWVLRLVLLRLLGVGLWARERRREMPRGAGKRVKRTLETIQTDLEGLLW